MAHKLLRSPNRVGFCGVAGLLAILMTGCMAVPHLYLHEYEGEVISSRIFSVEDGRRVELVRVQIVRNDPSPWRGESREVLLIQATPAAPSPGPDDLPLFEGQKTLRDQSLLKRLVAGVPRRRDPRELARSLQTEPSPRDWGTGYVVALRPFTVAFSSRPVTTQEDAPVTSRLGQTLTAPALVDRNSLGVEVDTLQILGDGGGALRIVNLSAPTTIDATLDLLADRGSQ